MSTSSHDPAVRRLANLTEKRKNRDHLAVRRELRRQAETLFGVPMEWHGGILYFSDYKDGEVPTEVPGMVHVPKPGRPVVGYSGAHPQQTSFAGSRRRCWRRY